MSKLVLVLILVVSVSCADGSADGSADGRPENLTEEEVRGTATVSVQPTVTPSLKSMWGQLKELQKKYGSD